MEQENIQVPRCTRLRTLKREGDYRPFNTGISSYMPLFVEKDESLVLLEISRTAISSI